MGEVSPSNMDSPPNMDMDSPSNVGSPSNMDSQSNMGSQSNVDCMDVDCVAISPASEIRHSKGSAYTYTEMQMSSPGREAGPRVLKFSAAVCSGKWRELFSLIPQKVESTLIDGLEFCRSGKMPGYKLLEINTFSGKPACLKATEKQWDTVIKEAKAADKLPDKMKTAHFHFYGKNDIEKKLDHDQVMGQQVPLEKYAKDRYEELRQERKRVLEGGEPRPKAKKGQRQYLEESSANVEIMQSPVRSLQNIIAQPSPKPKFTAAKEFYFRLGYINWVGEKFGNLEFKSLDQDLPKASTHLVELLLLWNGTEEAQKLQILAGYEDHKGAPRADRKFPNTIYCRLCGYDDRPVYVFRCKEFRGISFKDILSIDYNESQQALLVKYMNRLGNQDEIIMMLLPVEIDAWMQLQTCCYQLPKNTRGCNARSDEYFAQKHADYAKQKKAHDLACGLANILPPGTPEPVTPEPVATGSDHPLGANPDPFFKPDSTLNPFEGTQNRRGRTIRKSVYDERNLIIDCRARAVPIRPSNFGQDRIAEWEARHKAIAAAQAKSLVAAMFITSSRSPPFRVVVDADGEIESLKVVRVEDVKVKREEIDDDFKEVVKVWGPV